MLRVVVGEDNRIGAWVAQQVGKYWVFGAGRAFGWVDDDGRLLGAVSFTNYDGMTVWLDAAGVPKSGWLTRAGLRQIFYHCFVTLNCVRASAMVPENNEKSRKMLRQIGFKEEARLKHAAPNGGDMLIVTLFKDDCAWLVARK